MGTRTRLVTLASTLLCLGCANISTLDRVTVLPPRAGLGFVSGTGPQVNEGRNDKLAGASGLAIHLDAPQRIVFAREGFVCAEPSPDALQAYAQSFGFGLNIPGTASAEVAQALATSASSMGLRTQSITLMRDHLYRMCEASYNDQISKFDVAQLLRRSQDMTLGVLAIEQLTGAVVAQQVLMSSGANAHASANLTATKKELDGAVKKEKLAEEDLNDKKEEFEALDSKYKAADEAYREAREGTEAEKTTKNDLLSRAKELKQKRDEAEKLVEQAKENFEAAQKVTKEIKANFYSAGAYAESVAKGDGKFIESPYNNRSDMVALNAVSTAVREMVEKVIHKDHLRDSCISIMNRQAEAEENRINEEAYLKRLEQWEEKSRKAKENTLPERLLREGKSILSMLVRPSEQRILDNLPPEEIKEQVSQAKAETEVRATQSEKKATMYQQLFRQCLDNLATTPQEKKDGVDKSKDKTTDQGQRRM